MALKSNNITCEFRLLLFLDCHYCHVFSALPAPKERELEIVDAAGEDELDELVKPKESQLADAPKPPGRCTGKKPARIMIPALIKVQRLRKYCVHNFSYKVKTFHFVARFLS